MQINNILMTDQTQVLKVIDQIIQSPHSYALLEFDANYFAQSSTITVSEKSKIMDYLVQTFCNESSKRQFVAGVVISDLLAHSWARHGFDKSVLQSIVLAVQEINLEEQRLRNLQSKIIALCLEHIILEKINSKVSINQLEDVFSQIFEPICEKIQESDPIQIDLGLRIVILFIQRFDDSGGQNIRLLHPIVPLLLPALLQAFTSEEVGSRIREKILHIFYQLIRLVTWADGIENELVEKCLGDHFQSWMALFLQIIQSQKQNFEVKKYALKCLIVIFRDLINFSKDSINMILKPAWKLLNSHLPIFTEVIAYHTPIPTPNELDSDQNDDLFGNESFEEDQKYGIEGMTFHLLELLSTLVMRPNVQALVLQGLVPLLTSVSSYLLIQHDLERVYRSDPTYFIADKSQELLKVETIRSQCLVLISSLIEVFGDAATQGVLLIIEKLMLNQQPTVSDEETKSHYFDAQPKTYENSEDIVQDQEDQEEQRQALEFQALLQELTYVSIHPKNNQKRRESAILLASVFIEDISMYMIRNPKYDAQTLIFDQFLKTDFRQAPKSFSLLLVGRFLQSALSLSELVRLHEPRGQKYVQKIIQFSAESLLNDQVLSIQLIALKTLLKFARKLKAQDILANQQSLDSVVEPIIKIIDRTPLEQMYLPIEALALFSRVSPEIITSISPQITPKLLTLFKNHHHEGALGSELVNLFKQWSNQEACRQIMVQTFVPFILEIVHDYYTNTPNAENKSNQSSLKDKLANLELVSEKEMTQDAVENSVDAGILAHVLDFLCQLLRKANSDEDRTRITKVFPELMSYLERSDDMFLLLNGTIAVKNFINLAHKQVLELVDHEKILSLCKRLLSPSCNEQAGICLGNLVIQVIHKIQPKVDTQMLLCVVWKIYKSRMPSTVQSLILIIARLIQTNPNEITTFLSQQTIDNRISLKIVLDKWLLQQPLFRGSYTRTVTICSLLKMFQARDPRVETLMVIGYNPSHSNINSEVNAPFKILSLLLRFLENESKPTKLRPLRKPVEDYDEDDQKPNYKAFQNFGNYEMKRSDKIEREDLNQDSSQRMDTMGMDKDSYGSNNNRYDLAEEDKLSVDLDDVIDDDEPIDLEAQSSEEEQKQTKNKSESGLGKGTDQSTDGSQGNLFAVGKSKDKGLADMETGSEVYMSELLAGFDMEDFEDADEANEEDLLELQDDFAKVDNLEAYIKDKLNSIIQDEEKGCQYVYYCAKQLPKEDILLVQKFLKFPKEVPPISV